MVKVNENHQKDWDIIKDELKKLKEKIDNEWITENNWDNIKSSFVKIWTIERIENMSLEEYTDTAIIKKDNNIYDNRENRDYTFTYWIENILDGLWNIKWWWTAIKFWIYKHNWKRPSIYSSDKEHAWKTSLWNNKFEVFEIIKDWIIEIINDTKSDNLEKIETNNIISEIFKWKISFLYDEKNRILPIFSRNLLENIAKNHEININNNYLFFDLYQALLSIRKYDESIYSFVWRLLYWTNKKTAIYQISKSANNNANNLLFSDENLFAWDYKKFQNMKIWDTVIFVNPNINNNFSILYTEIIDVNWLLKKENNSSFIIKYWNKKLWINYKESEWNDLSKFDWDKFFIFKIKKSTKNPILWWKNIWAWLFKYLDKERYDKIRIESIISTFNYNGEEIRELINKDIYSYAEKKSSNELSNLNFRVISELNLIWIYIDKYRVIKKQFINFSWKRLYSFKENEIIIKENNLTNLIKSEKNKWLKNLTAIVWKNWTGKSSVLWLISNFFYNIEKNNKFVNDFLKHDEWYNLYFSNDNESLIYKFYSNKEDIDIFEVNGNNLIKIENEKWILNYNNLVYSYINTSPIDDSLIKTWDNLIENLEKLKDSKYIYWWVIQKNAFFPSRTKREILLNILSVDLDWREKLIQNIILKDLWIKNFHLTNFLIEKDDLIVNYWEDFSFKEVIHSFIEIIRTISYDNHEFNIDKIKKDIFNLQIKQTPILFLNKLKEVWSYFMSYNNFKWNIELFWFLLLFLKGDNKKWISFTDAKLIDEFEDLLNDIWNKKVKQANFRKFIKKIALKNNINNINIYKLLIFSRLINIDIWEMSSWEFHILWLIFKIIALYRYTRAENILITLDEPDINLHPEWSRRFIDIIYKFFWSSWIFQWEKNIQIIITTHSPLILSDLSPININFLYKDEDKKSAQEFKNSNKSTFLNNLYEILNSPFFISSYIWEFAKSQFEKEKANFNKEFYDLIWDEVIKWWYNNLTNNRKKWEE